MHPRIQELAGYLDAQRAVLRDAFERTPRPMRGQSPAPGRWSVAGIVEHLAITEQRLAPVLQAKIIEAQAAGLGPEPSIDPLLPTLKTRRIVDRSTRVSAPEGAQPTGLEADEAWAAVERSGAAMRAALMAGDGLALGTIFHPHPILGPMSVYQWFGFLAAHEARHADQIREAAAMLRG